MVVSMNERFTFGAQIDGLLDRLHSRSTAQEAALSTYFMERASDPKINQREFDERTNDFLRDKLVALERPKAEFCYQVCRALRARRVVEAGTSFGVSTVYLAAAVRDSVRAEQLRELDAHPEAVVIGTEHEKEKVAAARENFEAAGLSDFIDLRHGDLRQTLQDVKGLIDFMLIDIWVPMALPALELIAPRLRTGAVVICDNTLQFREAYVDYLNYIRHPPNGFRTMTLPFDGGLEFTVRVD